MHDFDNEYRSDDHIKNEVDFRNSLLEYLKTNIDFFEYTDTGNEYNPLYKFIKKFSEAKSIEAKIEVCLRNNDLTNKKDKDVVSNYYRLFSSREKIQYVIDNYDSYIVRSTVVSHSRYPFRFIGLPKQYVFSRPIPNNQILRAMTNLLSNVTFFSLKDLFDNSGLKDSFSIVPVFKNINIDWSEFERVVKFCNAVSKKLNYNAVNYMIALLDVVSYDVIDNWDEFESFVYKIIALDVPIKDIVALKNILEDKSNFYSTLKIIVDEKVPISTIYSLLNDVPKDFLNEFDNIFVAAHFIEDMDKYIAVYDIEFRNIDSKKYISVIDANFTLCGVYSGRIPDPVKFCKDNKQAIIKYLVYKILSNRKYKSRLKNSKIAPLQFYKISNLRVNSKSGDCQMKLDLKNIKVSEEETNGYSK